VLTTTVTVRRLMSELQSLPTRPTVAVRVVMAANDPNSSAETLGRLIEVDPALTTHVMRLANSAYYGLTHRVASAHRAVAVIGIGTARAIAAGTATGIIAGRRTDSPAGFWEHSVSTAVAASMVAPRVGASPAEAFSLGLLHDIGRALLYRCEPALYLDLTARVERGEIELLDAEYEAFGLCHATVAADILAEWNFPDQFVDAIAQHHVLSTDASPLRRALAAGEELTFDLDAPSGHAIEALSWPSGAGLAGADLSETDAQRLRTAIVNGTAELVVSFSAVA